MVQRQIARAAAPFTPPAPLRAAEVEAALGPYLAGWPNVDAARVRRWALETGLKPLLDGDLCWRRLANDGRGRCVRGYANPTPDTLSEPHRCLPDGSDHVLCMWGRGGRALAIVSQPYGFQEQPTKEFCEARGLAYTVAPRAGWWNQCDLVVITARGVSLTPA